MDSVSVGSLGRFGPAGRFGQVVGARAVGETADGRQVMALQVRTMDGQGARPGEAAATGSVGGPRPAAALSFDQLSDAERKAVEQLRQRDQQVKQEEKAHAAAAGDLAGPINYTYQKGPDGRLYAVGGSVSIKATSLSGSPEEQQRLGARLAMAAMVAINPSAADYRAARQGYGMEDQAQARRGDQLDEIA